jgi:hypothetical protein
VRDGWSGGWKVAEIRCKHKLPRAGSRSRVPTAQSPALHVCTSGHTSGDHTASHPKHNATQCFVIWRTVAKSCENSEELFVNLSKTHPIPRAFCFERSGKNTILLSQRVVLDSPIDLAMVEYLFAQRLTLPFIRIVVNAKSTG